MYSRAPKRRETASPELGGDVSTVISSVDINLAPAEILIVDDDDTVLERLKFIASSAGYQVRTARNGMDALESLKRRPCPLVLTDLMMPQMNGLDLCQAIRASPFDGYIYTIILSVRDGSKDVVAGLEAGADDYVSKRATKSEMLARLLAGRRVVGLEQALRRAVRAIQ